jgi:hypothetical protein
VAESERYIHEDNLRAIARFGQLDAVARIPHLAHTPGQLPEMSELDRILDQCNFLRESPLRECLPNVSQNDRL